MTTSRPRLIGSWIVAVLLCFVFVGAGTAKLAGSSMMIEEFRSFDYPLWFMDVTGALEVIGAVLVLVPGTARVGAALLACIMLGALATHLTHGQFAKVGPPIVLLALALGFLELRGGFRAPLYVRTPRSTAR